MAPSLEEAITRAPYKGWHALPIALYENGSTSGTAYDSWGFNTEDLYNYETDCFNPRALKMLCPNCQRVCSPLCSPYTAREGGGLRWVGLDHKEPYTDYRARCPGCKQWYRFTTFIPQ